VDVYSLKPVFAERRDGTRLLSARSTFFTAFFGGPLAALLVGAFNSRQLGQWKTDAALHAVLWVVAVAFIVAQGFWVGTEAIPDWFPAIAGNQRRTLRWAGRGLAIGLWLATWYPHRSAHRSAELMGVEPLPPWKHCAAAVAVGSLLTVAIASAVAIPLRMAG
jgi:hypothetical protein